MAQRKIILKLRELFYIALIVCIIILLIQMYGALSRGITLLDVMNTTWMLSAMIYILWQINKYRLIFCENGIEYISLWRKHFISYDKIKNIEIISPYIIKSSIQARLVFISNSITTIGFSSGYFLSSRSQKLLNEGIALLEVRSPQAQIKYVDRWYKSKSYILSQCIFVFFQVVIPTIFIFVFKYIFFGEI